MQKKPTRQMNEHEICSINFQLCRRMYGCQIEYARARFVYSSSMCLNSRSLPACHSKMTQHFLHHTSCWPLIVMVNETGDQMQCEKINTFIVSVACCEESRSRREFHVTFAFEQAKDGYIFDQDLFNGEFPASRATNNRFPQNAHCNLHTMNVE